MIRTLTLLAILSMALSACTTSDFTVRPTGDQCNVQLKSGKTIQGELLLVRDSLVYFISGGSVVRCQADRVLSVEVNGYSNHGWVLPVLLFEGLPPILLAAAASSADGADAGAVAAVGSIPLVLTLILFEVGQPSAPKVESPVMSEERTRLRTFARFPQGLTDDQLARVVTRNGGNVRDVE